MKVTRARRAKARRLIAAAALGSGIALAVVVPGIASAAGHTCSSNNICYFNSANLAADPVNQPIAVNPWGAVSGNYPNLYNPFPSPHTYNNPEVCNQTFALSAQCNENDTISSAENTSSTRKVRLYNNASYSGGFQTLSVGTTVGQVTYNDQTSSFCWNDGSAGVSACRF